MVREAAQREASSLYPFLGQQVPEINRGRRQRQKAYIKGAVWVAGRLPSRDEIAAMFTSRREPEYQIPEQEDFDDADAVLALIREHVTKEDNGGAQAAGDATRLP